MRTLDTAYDSSLGRTGLYENDGQSRERDESARPVEQPIPTEVTWVLGYN